METIQYNYIANYVKLLRMSFTILKQRDARFPVLVFALCRKWYEMNRSHALELLTQSKPILAARYGVTRLALFGSTARDAARVNSQGNRAMHFS